MTNQPQICEFCGDASLKEMTHSRALVFDGEELEVAGLEAFSCARCGESNIFPDQFRRNQKRIADAKREASSLLTSGEIQQIREQLSLSQPRAAEVFGGGPTAFSKYERGVVIQSQSMDRLLRCASRFSVVADFLFELAKVDRPSVGADYTRALGNSYRRATDIVQVWHAELIHEPPVNDVAYQRRINL